MTAVPAAYWVIAAFAVATMIVCEVGRMLGLRQVLSRMRHANSAGWGAMMSGTLDDAAKEAAARRQSLALLGASQALFARVVLLGAIALAPILAIARLVGVPLPTLASLTVSPLGMIAVAVGVAASMLRHRHG